MRCAGGGGGGEEGFQCRQDVNYYGKKNCLQSPLSLELQVVYHVTSQTKIY